MVRSPAASWYNSCMAAGVMYWCKDHLYTIAVIYILATAVCSGDVVITSSPQNFTASVGATATFQCEYTGTTDIPQWEIGGTEYGSTSLPPQHVYTANGLHVENVQSSMNNTMYICVVLDYDPIAKRPIKVRSDPAYLIVVPSIIVYTVTETMTPLPEAEETVTVAPTNVINVNLKTQVQPSMVHTHNIILNPSAVSEITDPPKFLGIPGSSASISLHPTETVAANVSHPQPQQLQKIYLYIGVCIGVVVLSLSVLVTAAIIFFHYRNLGKKGEESYIMKQNSAYEVTHPQARVPTLTNEAYGISLPAEENYNMKQNTAYEVTHPQARVPTLTNEAYGISLPATDEIEAYATTSFAIHPTTEADAESTIEAYATTTATIRDMVSYTEAYGTQQQNIEEH